MTKWKRLRKLREKKRAEAETIKPKAEVMAELTEPEIKPTERISSSDPRKIKKSEPKEKNIKVVKLSQSKLFDLIDKDKFVQLARDVYLKNDKRSKIKLKINKILGSNIQEVKQYTQY